MNYGKLHQVMPKMVMVLSDNNVVPTQSETCSDFLAHSKVQFEVYFIRAEYSKVVIDGFLGLTEEAAHGLSTFPVRDETKTGDVEQNMRTLGDFFQYPETRFSCVCVSFIQVSICLVTMVAKDQGCSF